MSVINHSCLFWFGLVLLIKRFLAPHSCLLFITGNNQYIIYISGIGTGALLGNFVFTFGGKWIKDFFATTTIIQFVKILYHQDGISKFEQNA